MRVFRIPFSTNVERVALALGHKGVAVEWVDVDPADRSPVRDVSGQDLVPVLGPTRTRSSSTRCGSSPGSRAAAPIRRSGRPARAARRGRRLRRLVQPRLEGAAERDRGRAAPPAARRDPARRGARSSAAGCTGSRACSRDATTSWATASAGRRRAFPFLKYGVLSGTPTTTSCFTGSLWSDCRSRAPSPASRRGSGASTNTRAHEAANTAQHDQTFMGA